MNDDDEQPMPCPLGGGGGLRPKSKKKGLRGNPRKPFFLPDYGHIIP
jgi:hypothetical protein